MRPGLITTKLGMSAIFNQFGAREAVTLLKVEDCQVVGHKKNEKDGYSAVIVAGKKVKPSKLAKSQREFFNKSKLEPKKIQREFRADESDLVEKEINLKADHFAINSFVDVVSISKGKGFAGVMKRHNFAGLEATHGVSVSHRSHGSTGQCQDPGKVFKNKKMAGQMGNKRVTQQNLKVLGVDLQENILIIKGAVPGSKGSTVIIKDALKKQ